MEQVGRVIGRRAAISLVKIRRHEACSRCGGCARLGEKELIVEVKDPVGARIGDFVRIEMGSAQFLSAAALVYILPLVFIVVGFWAGSFVGKLLGHAAGVLPGTTGALVSFLGAICLIRIIDRRLEQSGRLSPYVVEAWPAEGGADAEGAASPAAVDGYR